MKRHQSKFQRIITTLRGKVKAAVRCAAIKKTIRNIPDQLPEGIRFSTPHRIL